MSTASAGLNAFSTLPCDRLGMLVPSSNTALEPATAALINPLADQVGVHFARFRVTRIALDGDADAQFSNAPILDAAGLLADAKTSVIAWNGTSASWRGFETDDELCRTITERTGCKATSAIVGLNEALRLLEVKRLGLVTPYTADVEAAIAANYAMIGVEIVATRRMDLSDNYSFAEVTPEQIAGMCRDVAQERPDAIAIVCTNMRGPFIAPAIEAEFGIPVLDSISVTLWAALRAINVSTAPLSRYGRLFAEVE
ncbi:MAG: aspartate/glutamate racemase family protein [Pseudomonadota bacterium]